MFLRLYQEAKFPLDNLVTQRYELKDINEACGTLQLVSIHIQEWARSPFDRLDG